MSEGKNNYPKELEFLLFSHLCLYVMNSLRTSGIANMEMPMDMISFLFLFIQYIWNEQQPHEKQGVKYYEKFIRICMDLTHLCLKRGVSK